MSSQPLLHLKPLALTGFLCLILSLFIGCLSAQNQQDLLLTNPQRQSQTALTDSVDYINSIAVINGSNLAILDVNHGKETLNIPLSSAQNRLHSIDTTRTVYVADGSIQVANQVAYLVFASQRSLETTPQFSQIVQVDLKTGQETTIYERNGITQLILSPDGEKGLVAYYGDKIQRGVPTDICLLTITTGICQELNFNTTAERLNWIDNQFFTAIYAQNGLQSRIFDADTLDSELLNLPEDWFLYSIKTIPGTRDLLMTAISKSRDKAASQFLIYNVDAQNLSNLGYNPLKDNTSIGDFSPGNQYLMYGSFNRAIVEFKTGKLIAELTNVTQAVWLSDSTEIVATVTTEHQTQLIRLDITTGETKVLESGKDFVLLLNKV